jgi:hypothetical protein
VQGLPHIDERSVEVEAGRERVWRALVKSMPRSTPGAAQVAAALGCRERAVTGDFERPGSTIVGFRVEQAEAPVRLALGGRHRFSRYALTFAIDDLGGGRSRLRAITDAAFPGLAGRAYRALVIGTRAHVAATHAMLAGVRREAERSSAT